MITYFMINIPLGFSKQPLLRSETKTYLEDSEKYLHAIKNNDLAWICGSYIFLLFFFLFLLFKLFLFTFLAITNFTDFNL